MQRNIECRNRRDVTRRSILENLAVYNESWAKLDAYQTRLDGLWYAKERAYKEMLDSKILYERKSTSVDFEKKNLKRAQRSLDEIEQTLSLEKCISDFYHHVLGAANKTTNNKNRNESSVSAPSLLRFSGVYFDADVVSRENVLLQFLIDGDDRFGPRRMQFVISTEQDPQSIALRSGIRQTVQTYLCQRNSKRRKRRSITETVATSPLGRHGDLRFSTNADDGLPKTSESVIQCLHAKTIFKYIRYLVDTLKEEIKDHAEENIELQQDVQNLQNILPQLKKRVGKNNNIDSTAILLDQIHSIEDSIQLGKRSLLRMSQPREVVKSWKRKMRVYTSSNNFTSCLNLGDCLETALDNLYELRNKDGVSRSDFHSRIDHLKSSLGDFVSDSGNLALSIKELSNLAQKSVKQLISVQSASMICERPPKPKLNAPIQIDAMKGEKVTIRCSSATTMAVTGSAQLKVNYAWTHSGKILPFETQPSLSVYVSQETAGHYRCVTWNRAGNATSNATHIVVRQKPALRQQPSDVTHLLMPSSSNSVEPFFHCDVTADPAPTIAWYYQPFQQKVAIRLHSARKPVYTVSNPRPSNSGYYYCVAANRFGSVYSRKTRLDVLLPTLSPQELSVSFDLSIGNVEQVDKASYQEKIRNLSSTDPGVQQNKNNHQFLEIDLEASGESKVKFEVLVKENLTLATEQQYSQKFSRKLLFRGFHFGF